MYSLENIVGHYYYITDTSGYFVVNSTTGIISTGDSVMRGYVPDVYEFKAGVIWREHVTEVNITITINRVSYLLWTLPIGSKYAICTSEVF